MTAAKTALAALLALALVGAGCGDDSSVDSGATTVPGGSDGTSTPQPDGGLPDRAPDLVGTITTVTPFEPITEDCTPPEDLDPDGTVSSDDPPICTPADNDVLGTVLVEERPEVQEGRKISYTVISATVLAGETADGARVAEFGDLAEGQLVDSWVPLEGMCAESYPEQCTAEAIRVTG